MHRPGARGAQRVPDDRYACSSRREGKACTNDIFVSREQVEPSVLAPIRAELLAPTRVAMMVKEMERLVTEQGQHRARVAAEHPSELVELAARIQRLRDQQAAGLNLIFNPTH